MEQDGKTLQVWFEDESRFGQQGCLTRVWATKGSRPRAVRQTQYDYLWVLSAVCPLTGEACAFVFPYLDTSILNIFLSEFAAQLDPGVVALLIWDGAAFHRSQDLVVPDNVRILQLPPYSPELNPIENLWHYLKSHFWSNRFYPDYRAMEDAAQTAWLLVSSNPDLLKSICAAPYLA